MNRTVPVDTLTPALLKKHPVWEFMPESSDRDETWVKPVARLPVRTLDNRVIATGLTLANGKIVLGLLGNVDLRDPEQNEHLLTLAVFNGKGKLFHLARYHDVDHRHRGPKQLAEFLRLEVTDVFPISYDLAPVARGVESCRRAVIPAKPRKRLSKVQLMDLILG